MEEPTITYDDVLVMRTLRIRKYTLKDIATRFNVPVSVVKTKLKLNKKK